MANTSVEKLRPYFKNMSLYLVESANGINNDRVVSEEVICKGISNEITLQKDVTNKTELYDNLLFLSNKVGLRLRKQNRYAYVVAVILKDKYFKRKTHQKKLLNPINSSIDIFEVSKQILNDMWNDDSVRLIGIRLDNLVENYNYQRSLFENNEKININSNLDKTLDKLKEKYGDKIIENADLKKKL